MDSTLIQAEVIDELAKLAGVGEQVARITEAAMRGELDFDASFTRRVALLRGLPAERVDSLVETIPLAEGAERLIRTLRLLGYKTAILSGGFTFFARRLQQQLGIDYVHANELEIADGVVTGRVVPPIVNAEGKADLLRAIAAGKTSLWSRWSPSVTAPMTFPCSGSLVWYCLSRQTAGPPERSPVPLRARPGWAALPHRCSRSRPAPHEPV